VTRAKINNATGLCVCMCACVHVCVCVCMFVCLFVCGWCLLVSVFEGLCVCVGGLFVWVCEEERGEEPNAAQVLMLVAILVLACLSFLNSLSLELSLS
jgi:hypothetical protein